MDLDFIFLLKLCFAIYFSFGVLHCILFHYEFNFGECSETFQSQVREEAIKQDRPEWSILLSVYFYVFKVGIFLIFDFIDFINKKFKETR